MADRLQVEFESSGWLTNPIRRPDNAIRKAILRRQTMVPAPPPVVRTTELGTSASVSPRTEYQARIYIERYDRRSVLTDVARVLADNPLIAQAATVFVDTAVSKGFTVAVHRTSVRGTIAGVQKRAQRVIDRIIKDCDLRNKIPSWGRKAMEEGDLFIQNVEHKGQLVNAKRMPAATMERMTDERDAFVDVLDAYHQLDVGTNEIIGNFALWQVTHGRWNYTDGERYGNSHFLQLRELSRAFLEMVREMPQRRKIYGQMRFFHQVGTKDHPGAWEDVQRYRQENSLVERDRRGDWDLRSQFFGNGLTSVTALHGDGHLDQIKDLEFVLNVIFPRTNIAKGLIGFGETVSRDVLDEQREFMYTQQDLLIDFLEWGALRPTFDLGLMMEGINPDSVLYAIQFEDRMTEAGKLARLQVLLEVYEAGLMTDEQFCQRASAYLGIKNVEEYVSAIREMKAKKQEGDVERVQVVGADPRSPGAVALVKSVDDEAPGSGKTDLNERLARGKGGA
jgi:hypothetical protein